MGDGPALAALLFCPLWRSSSTQISLDGDPGASRHNDEELIFHQKPGTLPLLFID